MSKIVMDEKTRKKFVESGKIGGDITKEKQPDDYFSKNGRKSWKARVAREGKAALRKRMSENGKKSRALAAKKKAEAEKKKNKEGFGGRLHKFLTNGDIT